MKNSRAVNNERDAHRSGHDVQLSSHEQAQMIVALLVDLCEPDAIDQLGAYFKHVRFDLSALRRPQDLIAAWLGHYRIRQGRYDVERAFNDLATFPPIAAEITRLQKYQRKV